MQQFRFAPKREARTFTVPGVSPGSDAMRDVYDKLAWAEKHLADLMSLGRDYPRPGGGDDRPLGIEFDNSRRPIDLIQVRDRKMVLSAQNVWVSAQPIAHGTVMARFRIRGLAKGLLRVDPNAEIRLSTGRSKAPGRHTRT
jgi:hypothetical protein